MIKMDVLLEIGRERLRQEELKKAGRFSATLADPMSESDCMVLLLREIGEAARCVPVEADRRPEIIAGYPKLREELVQCAAVCVAWIERLSAAEEPNELEAIYTKLKKEKDPEFMYLAAQALFPGIPFKKPS